jgi:hypothetical protein
MVSPELDSGTPRSNVSPHDPNGQSKRVLDFTAFLRFEIEVRISQRDGDASHALHADIVEVVKGRRAAAAWCLDG